MKTKKIILILFVISILNTLSLIADTLVITSNKDGDHLTLHLGYSNMGIFTISGKVNGYNPANPVITKISAEISTDPVNPIFHQADSMFDPATGLWSQSFYSLYGPVQIFMNGLDKNNTVVSSVQMSLYIQPVPPILNAVPDVNNSANCIFTLTAWPDSKIASWSKLEIYYTINGEIPTKDNGTLYTQPFSVSNSLIRAIAVSNNGVYSKEVVSNIISQCTISGDINILGNLYKNGQLLTFNSWLMNGNNMFYNTGNIGIGTDQPTEKLSVNGTIKAKKLIASSQGWADFVFNPDYYLRPLPEVENYVKDNKHLPDMPSETEVKANGISVADMDAKLLQKIEELTLYVIKINQENQKSKADIEELKKTNESLEARLERLEQLLSLR
jgi:hypothetical protein